MKIAVVIRRLPFGNRPTGGAEVASFTIAKLAAQFGHSVSVLYDPLASKRLVPLQLIHEHPNLRFVPMLVPLRANERSRLQGLARRGFNLIASFIFSRIEMRLSANLYYVLYDLSLLEMLTHHRNSSFRLVCRVAGFYWQSILCDPHLAARYSTAIAECHGLHFISKDLVGPFVSEFASRGVEFEDVKVFIGDIGPERTKPGPAAHPTESRGEAFRILCAARFDGITKRQELLLRALVEIGNAIPVRVRFIGEGPSREEVASLAKRLGVGDKVEFSDYSNRQTFLESMSNFDALALPTESEGLSRTIIDAMAMGLPVIASEVPGLSYVRNNVTGFKCRNTPEAWAQVIKYVAEHREIRQLVAKNASDLAETPVIPKGLEYTLVDFLIETAGRKDPT